MNKTKIEWCDSTWNPVTGCLHGCEYCYAKRIAERFGGHTDVLHASEYPEEYEGKIHVLDEPLVNGDSKAAYPFGFEPTLLRYKLDEPLRKKKPQTIFVCSMADLFGRWVPTKWIVEVLDACRAAPQHRYLFLTKHPARYMELDEMALLPREENFWYGSTAATAEAPMFWSDEHRTFASLEPLLGPMGKPQAGDMHGCDWYIIGAETGNRKGKVTPEREWVQEIVDYCRASGKPVFMKDSLLPVMGEAGMLREFPWEWTP